MKTLAFVIVLNLFALAAEACPVINGRFVKQGDARATIRLVTVESVTNSYGLDGMDPQPADGQPHRLVPDGRAITLTYSCSGNVLHAEVAVDGNTYANLNITKVNENRLLVQSNLSPKYNGDFTKE